MLDYCHCHIYTPSSKDSLNVPEEKEMTLEWRQTESRTREI